MRARIYTADRQAMQSAPGKSMSAFAREALARLLSGEYVHPPKARGGVANATFVLPEDMESQVRKMADELGVSLDELVRAAVHDRMLDLGRTARRAEELITREEAHLTRQEALLNK